MNQAELREDADLCERAEKLIRGIMKEKAAMAPMKFPNRLTVLILRLEKQITHVRKRLYR